MTNMPKYFDKRSEQWAKWFEQAQPYDLYLEESAQDHASRWVNMANKLPALNDQQQSRLTGYNRKLNVLVYSGVWCGDCVRQGPMLHQIAQACGEQVQLRVIDRDVDSALTDELRILGAMRVPMVVFLTEDFWEVGRFGDRLLTIYRHKFRQENGAACSTGLVTTPGDELADEQNEWVDLFERMLLMVRLSPPLRSRYGD